MFLIGGISVFCDGDLATPSPHGDIRRPKGPGSFKHYKASELQQKFGITPRGLDRYRHTYSATGGRLTLCNQTNFKCIFQHCFYGIGF